MITQELIAALDDLLQAGAQASASLRAAIENLAGPRSWETGAVNSAENILNSVKTAARTEQSMPTLIASTRDAAVKLQQVAGRVGDAALESALGLRIQTFTAHMKASGLGTPWLTILGIGAGAIAAWYFWKEYTKKTKIASFEEPESEPRDDIRPRLKGMGRALGSFRAAPPCRQLGRGKRTLGGFGKAGKYEFEPETRLEGFRGKRRRSGK